MENQYYYDAIMALYGLQGMKDVLKKWKNVAHHLKLEKNMPIVLPNILWHTKPGIGKTYFLQLLSEYLSTTKLMSFYGTVKYLEFSMDFCPDEQDFSELRRLMRELEESTGYRGIFKGVLSIELDQWVGHFQSKHFKRLMAYLSGMDNSLCIFFILENESDEQLERILAQYVRIERVNSDYPEVSEFIAYIENWFLTYDFTMTQEAKSLLFDSVYALRSNDCFDGFKTLNLMCEDIIFEICAKDVLKTERIIDVKDIQSYSREGVFIKRLREMMQKRKIGFGSLDEVNHEQRNL